MLAPKSPLVRRAVGVMLLQQRAANEHIRAALNAEIADAAARAETRKKEERDAIILALLLASSARMEKAVAKSIVEQRQAARAAARARLGAEFKAAGIAIAAHQWALRSRTDEDEGYSTHAAGSLASQWRGLAIAAALGASSADKTPSQAIRSTAIRMRLRVQRTAETEVARAYSDEHAEALADIVAHDREYRDGEFADEIETRLGRQWSAMADACPTCLPLDDVTVGIGEPFPGGLEPGYVHIRCRCVSVYVSISEAMQSAA